MTFENQVLIFDSTGLEEDTLLVTRLVGTERISGLYRFELELASAKNDLDLQAILDAPARIGFREQIALAGGGTGWTKRWIAGELESFTYAHCRQGVSGYRAVLVPRLAQLEGTFRSRVFLDEHAPNIVKQILGADDLTSPIDHKVAQTIEDALAGSQHDSSVPSKDWDAYPSREYVVQYEETDLHFVSRWLEHEGIFYFFENDDAEVETLVLADGTSSYKPVKGRATIPFKPEGATTHGDTPGVHTLTCEVTRPPKQVVLKDYNWRAANEERDTVHALEAVSEAIPHGRGVSYEYNYHFKTKAQGEHLANVRAEGLRSRAQVFHGRSDCRNLRAGHTFELVDHDRADFNQAYLLTELRFEAEQNISLESRTVSGATFHCDFTAIPARETFRPEPETEWPAIRGVMHARIDGPDGAEYAELDPDGRYKVTLPFDQDGGSDKKKERASRYIRMATPYAGRDQGMHFPLHPGTDVLLTHIDGDPDRPLIAGAVPNAFSASVVHQGNHTRNRVQTSSGNVLEFEDEAGREGITIATEDGSSYMCFTKPGSMGAGGGGNGVPGAGSGGVAEAHRPASLPGAGMGNPPVDSATKERGFTEFATFDCFTNNKEESDPKTIKEAYAKVYPSGDVIEKLDANCSTFKGNIGVYSLVAGGPSVSAVFGDVGSYAKGTTKITQEEFENVTQNLDGSGTLTQNVGSKKKWANIKRSITCENYISSIGPSDYVDMVSDLAKAAALPPILVKTSKRAVFVMDDLSSTTSTLFLKSGPSLAAIDLSALRLDMKVGVLIDLRMGAQLKLNVGPVLQIDTSNKKVRLFRGQAAMQELKATLNSNVAVLNEKLAVVDSNAAAIKKTEASIKQTDALVDFNQTLIKKNQKVIKKQTKAIDYNATVLNTTNTGITHKDKAINICLQGAAVKVGTP